MTQKKPHNRVAMAVGVLCVVILIATAVVYSNDNSTLQSKDSEISSLKNQLANAGIQPNPNQTIDTNDKDSQIASLQNQVASLQSQNNEKDGTIGSLNSQISQKDSTISDMQGQSIEKDSTISNQKNQISDLQGQNNQMNVTIAGQNSQISNLQNQNIQKESTITSLSNQVSDLQNQKNNLTSQLSSLNSQISALNDQISQKNSQISSLNSQISSLNNDISQKNSTISNLTNTISILQNTTNSLGLQISNLNSQISTLNTQIAVLQTQNSALAAQIATLNTAITKLTLEYNNYVAAYQRLRFLVDQRSTYLNLMDFITPKDAQVISIVNSVTGGWSDTSNPNEFWADAKKLYLWVTTNINYRYDGLSPILPDDPSSNLYYREEMYQFPNETLTLKRGDCDDQAILLCSMIRCYSNMRNNAECITVTSSTAGHVAVQIPVSGDKLVIFDPAGEYYSKDFWGNIVFNSISVEISNWLNYLKSNTAIGSDVYVDGVFSDYVDRTFASTSEYISWMYI